MDNQRAGVHVYTRELISMLHSKFYELPYEVIIIRELETDEFPLFHSIAVKTKNIIGVSSIRKFLKIPLLLRKLGADLVLETTNFGPFFTPSFSKSITVIHDLTPILFPNWHTFNGWFWQKLLLPKIIRDSDLLLTVSYNTQHDIIDLFDVDPNKIYPIHLGVSRELYPTTDNAVLAKFNIPNEFFLSVGTIEPRKNHELILRAFEKVLNPNTTLVIAGEVGWKSKEILLKIKNHPKTDKIILTGYISEYEKRVLLTMCKAMIYASHYEGFGLPVIENGACANVSYVAYNSSLKELSNPLVEYFENEVQLMNLMNTYNKPTYEERLSMADTVRNIFSWENYLNYFLSTLKNQFDTVYNIPNKSQCAIIVLNWNGYNDTVECIESLLQSDLRGCNIYLIDNNSDNNEGPLLQSKYGSHSSINITLYSENYGFAGAHNKLWNEKLRFDGYEHVILINNDTTVHKTAIQTLRSHALEHKWSVASSKMINYYDRELTDSIGHMLFINGEILPRGHNRSIHSQKHFEKCIGGSGGGVLYTTNLINDIGLFDPFFDTGYEDAEYGLRAYMSGRRIGFAQESIIYHKGGASIKKIFNQNYAIRTQLNILYTVFKLFPPIILAVSLIVIFLRFVLISTGAFIMNRKEISAVLVNSHIDFFKLHLKTSLLSRKKFKKHRKINSLELYRMCHSTLRYDLIRLKRVLIKKDPTAMTKYR